MGGDWEGCLGVPMNQKQVFSGERVVDGYELMGVV